MRRFAVIAAAAAALVVAMATGASAGPIPPGFSCTGNCGTLGANGVVTLSPFGTSEYLYISTYGGSSGAGRLPGVGGTNGTTLLSPLFSAAAGDLLEFYFNYVTSDGAGFADYAWARVVDPALNEVALLITARTKPSGSIIPGQGLPAPSPGVTLTPPSVPIHGGTSWSPLGGYSGRCFSTGCGHTDWVLSTFAMPAAGNYYLQFGTTNWADTIYDSGMAIDGLLIGGEPIGTPVPEPGTLLLIGTGLVAAIRRRFMT